MDERSDDMELVERMRAGDESAFDTFGARYPRALYRFALHRLDGRRDLTREIVQSALAKALTKLDSYRGDASLLTWLCACCHNEIRMHRRHLRSVPAETGLEDDVEPAVGVRLPRPPDPEQAVLRGERGHLVHVALDALPEHYAQALEWKYLERLPVREIARRLDTTEKAAESLLTRARGAFRGRYDELTREDGAGWTRTDRSGGSDDG